MPGSYTIRLRKAGQIVESRIDLALDRRATYSVEDRQKNYDAQLKVVALFGDMSTLVDRIDAAQKGTAERSGALPKGDPLSARLRELREKLEQVKRRIVTTKEGGAITGEERIREHTDQLYGALLRYEGKPAAYQEARIGALRRELDDAQKEFDQLATTEIRAIDKALQDRQLPPIRTSASASEGVTPGRPQPPAQ